MHGQVSQNSLYRMKKRWMDTHCLVRRLTRKHTTSRPDNVWPDMLKHMSDASKRKEKQKWAIEKPKLENARRLRAIFFTDPDDTGKPVPQLDNTRRNMLVLMRPTNP